MTGWWWWWWWWGAIAVLGLPLSVHCLCMVVADVVDAINPKIFFPFRLERR